ncbi:MAG TPA: universal stress protein [Candidatus Dormibacteraeota bacterium]|nr:universal stress protein [Candidatus Dormibacteraeota bacterium]
MFQHILIAVDGSPHSQQTIPTAIELAKKFGGDVYVLHVRERDMGRAGAYPLETSEDAQQLVKEAVKKVRDAGVPVRGEAFGAMTGHAAKAIVETAKTEGSDLIIMGSRGLSDLAGLLLGSVTHKVAQLTHTPVLIVRAPELAAKAEPVGVAAEKTVS